MSSQGSILFFPLFQVVIEALGSPSCFLAAVGVSVEGNSVENGCTIAEESVLAVLKVFTYLLVLLV